MNSTPYTSVTVAAQSRIITPGGNYSPNSRFVLMNGDAEARLLRRWQTPGRGYVYSRIVRRSFYAVTRALILAVCAGLSPLSGSVCQATLPPGAAVTILETSLLRADWPERRSGEALLALPPVRTLLSVFAEDVGQRIIVRYPGGDLGNSWALEFREWLVALGVPSSYVTLEPGSGGPNRLLILLEVVSGGVMLFSS